MELEDADVEMLVMQKLASFTQEKACYEARMFEWIKSAWVNRTVKVKSSKVHSGIGAKETHQRWKGRKFLLHNKICTILLRQHVLHVNHNPITCFQGQQYTQMSGDVYRRWNALRIDGY